MNRPNIILMMADDLGIGDLSCYNSESKINTPNLDRLASQGLRCNDAHASSSLCTPSRYGLLTGRYNWRSRLKKVVLMGHEEHLIEDGRATIASKLKSVGYNTAIVGKWHLGQDWENTGTVELFDEDESILEDGIMGGKDSFMLEYGKPVANGPMAFGFDYSYITPGSLDIPPYVFLENDRVTERPSAITGTPDFMKTRNMGKGKDVPYMSGWPPGHTAENYDHMHVVPDSADRVSKLIDAYANEADPFFIYYPIHAPHVPCIPTPEYEGQSDLGPYGDMVIMIDDIVGRIMNQLEECGIADDTVFIFCSDNGSEHCFSECNHSSNYIYRGYKGDIWDGGHRIPYIVRYPKVISAGETCDQTICLTDIMATLFEMINIPMADTEGEDSISNLSLWKGGDFPVRDATVHHSGFGNFGIRKGRWKLEMCSGSGGFIGKPMEASSENEPGIQLYDMESDIGETTNVCEKYPEVVKELTELLTKYVLDGRSTPGSPQKNTGPKWWPQLNWMNAK
ncbi:MAG: arylsulfatase [Spirochaetales bacterium]|nr:arylsulfatase [Spirochaetales bacterium]